MPQGRQLIKMVLESTGLPTDSLEKELIRHLESRGLNPDHVSLEELRESLAIYLQIALLEAKKASS